LWFGLVAKFVVRAAEEDYRKLAVSNAAKPASAKFAQI
jgi:hypothetical protein